jgi:RimJ/RimL family protein N-acetyltransferase
MTAPHERAIPGPAADFAARLSAEMPVLETPRLRLRVPLLADFDAWAQVFTTEVSRFMDGPYDRDDAFTDFAASVGTWLLRGHGPLTIKDKATGAALGFVLIGFEPGDLEPELGWFLLPGAEGRGIAAEAATALRAHAFGPLGMTRLVSYIDPANTRSRALAARLGAVPEGMVDGSEAWVHRSVAQDGCHTPSHTLARQKADAKQTPGKGT